MKKEYKFNSCTICGDKRGQCHFDPALEIRNLEKRVEKLERQLFGEYNEKNV